MALVTDDPIELYIRPTEVPTDRHVAIVATAKRTAMSAYSIDVAPEVQSRKRMNVARNADPNVPIRVSDTLVITTRRQNSAAAMMARAS